MFYFSKMNRSLKNFYVIFGCIGGRYSRYHLSYHGFVPRNLTNRLNRITRSIFENGLNEFYWSLASLKSRINFMTEYENNMDNADIVKVVGLEQLSIFFLLYAVQITVAIGVFIIELSYG